MIALAHFMFVGSGVFEKRKLGLEAILCCAGIVTAVARL